MPRKARENLRCFDEDDASPAEERNGCIGGTELDRDVDLFLLAAGLLFQRPHRVSRGRPVLGAPMLGCAA